LRLLKSLKNSTDSIEIKDKSKTIKDLSFKSKKPLCRRIIKGVRWNYIEEVL